MSCKNGQVKVIVPLFSTALCEIAVKLLDIPTAIINEAITAELVEGNLVAEIIGEEDVIFLTPLYRAEVGCAAQLQRLNKGEPL